MRFVSTRGRAAPADLRTALFRGPAPDGGLYVPSALPRLSPGELRALRGASFQETAVALGRRLLGDAPGEEALRRIVRDALDFPVPLAEVGEGSRALELFHGPTLAFKDVGARFMARLVEHFHGWSGEARTVTVLVATSGDTGGAVAHAFHGVPGTRTVVLFPEGRVSPLQERQFTTLGGNVRALAVDGSFDDCQRLVKGAFADGGLREELLLTSANSINVGRLLPQVFYHFHLWGRLPEEPDELVVSVPSGNLGNLTAGLMAKRMGLPVTRFVAATNENDVLPEFLATGRFRPRTSRATLSSAMDVGDPSNFERILALYGGDRGRLRADVTGSAHDDRATRRAIREVHERHGYVLDPHSAVGWLGLREALAARRGAAGVFLATAHPAKFPEAVEEEIGRPVPLPPRLAACLERERRVATLEPRLEALAAALREGAGAP